MHRTVAAAAVRKFMCVCVYVFVFVFVGAVVRICCIEGDMGPGKAVFIIAARLYQRLPICFMAHTHTPRAYKMERTDETEERRLYLYDDVTGMLAATNTDSSYDQSYHIIMSEFYLSYHASSQ